MSTWASKARRRRLGRQYVGVQGRRTLGVQSQRSPAPAFPVFPPSMAETRRLSMRSSRMAVGDRMNSQAAITLTESNGSSTEQPKEPSELPVNVSVDWQCASVKGGLRSRVATKQRREQGVLGHYASFAVLGPHCPCTGPRCRSKEPTTSATQRSTASQFPTRAYGVSPILGWTVAVSTDGLNRGSVF